ncbi:MAG: hypothetical protein ACO3ZW_08505 [Opitutales bacterium]
MTGFAVRNEDGQWQVVTGRVEDKTMVVLKIDPMVSVTAVSYAWANNPVCNLVTGQRTAGNRPSAPISTKYRMAACPGTPCEWNR